MKLARALCSAHLSIDMRFAQNILGHAGGDARSELVPDALRRAHG